MTTLEVTALSYVLLMVATELCWLRKPSLLKPRSICTKDHKTVEDIRAYAKQNVCIEVPRSLPSQFGTDCMLFALHRLIRT